MKQTILITGGAGYIGSITAWWLREQGYHVIILDKKKIVWPGEGITTIIGDCSDQRILHTIFSTYQVQTVIHCAAAIEVGWSVTHPLACYQQNVAVTLTILQSMAQADVRELIFSSSAAVYGNSGINRPVMEEDMTIPINPYGWSKLMGEQMIADQVAIGKLRAVIFRYFNVSGALPALHLGEAHDPETHLIPRLLQAAELHRPCMIYGTEFSTVDGSCVRDYVHVKDIAQAHLQAIRYFERSADAQKVAIFNVGTGIGISVLQLIDSVAHVAKKQIVAHQAAPRPGDPPFLVADTTKLRTVLGVEAASSNLTQIVTDAYQFYQQQQELQHHNYATIASHQTVCQEQLL